MPTLPARGLGALALILSTPCTQPCVGPWVPVGHSTILVPQATDRILPALDAKAQGLGDPDMSAGPENPSSCRTLTVLNLFHASVGS